MEQHSKLLNTMTKRCLASAIAFLCAVSLFALSGCVTYKIDRGENPSNQLEAADKSLSDKAYQADSNKQLSSETAKATTDDEAKELIVNDLQIIAQSSGMSIGVACIDLGTGAYIDHQGSEPFVSASMIKLLVAYAFLEQVEKGSYTLDDYYTLQQSDIVGGTGSLRLLGAGAQVSYGEILNKMISASDNTGTNILIDAVGMDTINETAIRLELPATKMNRYMMDSTAIANGIENYTSAHDVAVLLEKVYNGTFVNTEASKIMLQALEAQEDVGGIIYGLPQDVVFAHKTGTLSTVRHDGGIAEGDKPFILVVLCGEPGYYEQGALSAMSQIASSIYAYMHEE